jgi:hypothetical protein
MALLCFRIGKKWRVRRDGLGNPKEEGISRMGWNTSKEKTTIGNSYRGWRLELLMIFISESCILVSC